MSAVCGSVLYARGLVKAFIFLLCLLAAGTAFAQSSPLAHATRGGRLDPVVAQAVPASSHIDPAVSHHDKPSHLSDLCDEPDKPCSSGGCCAAATLHNDLPMSIVSARVVPYLTAASIIEVGSSIEPRPPNVYD